VACKDIPAGTEITIHYSTTIERAHHCRDNSFREQHYMPLPPSPFSEELDGDLDGPQSALAKKVEVELDELDAGVRCSLPPPSSPPLHTSSNQVERLVGWIFLGGLHGVFGKDAIGSHARLNSAWN
jgi:hypothetical protein